MANVFGYPEALTLQERLINLTHHAYDTGVELRGVILSGNQWEMFCKEIGANPDDKKLVYQTRETPLTICEQRWDSKGIET